MDGLKPTASVAMLIVYLSLGCDACFSFGCAQFSYLVLTITSNSVLLFF